VGVKKVIIFADGGSRGNPGPSAVGFVFCNEKYQMFKEYSEYLGENITNNEAEYRGIILALKKFKAVFGNKLAKNTEIELRSDSELLISQLNGQYKILDEKIQPLFLEVWNLKIDFKKLKFKLISREKNQEADKLVNQALDNQNKIQKLI
jgi:ribonuclease HI